MAQFSSRIGLIAATVGSAVGLGAVWRFPNEVQSNGGAAFLLVYIACLLVLGIPVMLAEFSLGRGVGSDALGDFKRFTPHKPWWLTGAAALTASLLINGFYMVVAGWTFSYLWTSVTGSLYDGFSTSGMDAFFSAKMHATMLNPWQPIVWTFIVLLLNILILLRGVQKGIERMSNILMPLLFLMLVALCAVTLTLPGASEGVAFFLSPDFSKINPSLVVSALGQAFFSLSLGMGILLTYSAYYPKETNLVNTSFTVTLCSLLIAILMGFVVFPAVTSFGLAGNSSSLESTALVFVTLPEVFAQMPGCRLWSILFFTLLGIAALTSTLSIGEVGIKCIQDNFKIKRTTATWLVFLPLFILSPLCSLSLGPVKSLAICGDSLFDICDNVATNYLLPLSSFLTCIYVGWVVPKGFLRGELSRGGKGSAWAYVPVVFLIRYVAPILIVGIFAYTFLRP